MSESPILAQAIALAAKAHKYQLDKSGEPYILHPLRVMFRLRENGYSEAVQAAAVLHDVLEDTDVGLDAVLNIDPYVLDLVERVTRGFGGDGKKEEYANFIRRAAEHPMSRMIKYYDIKDNLSRLDNLTPENAEFLAKRYAKALVILREYDGSLV